MKATYEQHNDFEDQLNHAGGNQVHKLVKGPDHKDVCLTALAVDPGLCILDYLRTNLQGNQMLDSGIAAADSLTVQMQMTLVGMD